MTYIVITGDELYHHGIKGQKWGVRRFQNADGSLKAAGRERYTEDGSGGKKPRLATKLSVARVKAADEKREAKKARAEQKTVHEYAMGNLDKSAMDMAKRVYGSSSKQLASQWMHSKRQNNESMRELSELAGKRTIGRIYR